MSTTPPIASGLRRHSVTLQNPAEPTPDGDGSFLLTPPTTLAVVRASIERAGVKQLERVTSGTVLSQATHIVIIPYVAGVTTKTSVIFNGRTLSINDIANPDESNRELQLICMEVVP